VCDAGTKSKLEEVVAGCSQVSSWGCPEEAAIVTMKLFMRNPCNGTSILGVGIYCGQDLCVGLLLFTLRAILYGMNGTVVFSNMIQPCI
jgi:hypothetical protein